MREMKDSGVAWIGEIPKEWKTIKFSSFIERMGTGLNPRENFVLDKESPFYYVTIRNFKNGELFLDDNCDRISKQAFDIIQERSQLQKGDFLFASISKDAQIYMITENPTNWNINESVFCIRPKKHIFDLNFLYRLLSDYRYYESLLTDATGSTFLSIKQNKLKQSTLVLPPLSEQQKIASLLDKKCTHIDTLISNQQQQIEKLKAYKQSLITEVVTKGLNPDVPMKDSGVEWIGEIPEHWKVVPSKSMFSNSDERRHENDEQLTASQKYGMISQKEYMQRENCRIVLADKGLENWKHVEPFDFVISLRSFQGGLEMSEVSGCATWHYIILRPKKEIKPYYFKWLFKSSMYIRALQRTCNYIRDGQDLRYSNFVQVSLCIPPLEEQQVIAEHLDKKCSEIDSLIAIKQQKIEKLQQYKKSIIYEYVTGKKEVE